MSFHPTRTFYYFFITIGMRRYSYLVGILRTHLRFDYLGCLDSEIRLHIHSLASVSEN